MWKYFKAVMRAGWAILHLYFTLLLPYSKHPEKISYEKRFKKCQWCIRKVLHAFRINYEDTDLQEFYKNRNMDENYLIVMNHLSDLDPLILAARAERPITFVSKIENEKLPFVGKCIKVLEGEFMDRDDLKQSLRVMQNVEKKLNGELKADFVIFPEGTRNKGDIFKTLPYHHGTFRPAYKANKNIAAFMIYGDQKVLTLDDKSKSYTVKIKKVLEFNQEDFKDKKTTDLASIVEEETNKKLVELKKELMS